MLVDLDLQNHGATGLFESQFDLTGSDVFALLRADDLSDVKVPANHVAPNLYMLPAFSGGRPAVVEAPFLSDVDEARRRLQNVLQYLAERLAIKCFVLDCHGGIDTLSVAAAGIADWTIAVTEADTVTFAGTLSLIRSYYEEYGDRPSPHPRVEFVVNRLPPKYTWRDLDRVYRKYLADGLGHFTTSGRVACFLPLESYLSESFGEYPFQVEIAPGSLFTKKLELLLFELCRDTAQELISPRIRRRWSSTRRQRVVERTTISAEARTTRSVITTYAASALYVSLLLMPCLVVWGTVAWYSMMVFNKVELQKELKGEARSSRLPEEFVRMQLKAMDGLIEGMTPWYRRALPWRWPLTTLLVAFGIPLVISGCLTMWRSFIYFLGRFQFERRLIGVLHGERRAWREIAVWKFGVLCVGAAIPPLSLAILLLTALGVGGWMYMILHF